MFFYIYNQANRVMTCCQTCEWGKFAEKLTNCTIAVSVAHDPLRTMTCATMYYSLPVGGTQSAQARSVRPIIAVKGKRAMKSYDLRTLAAQEGGEYVLGMKDLHTHACYMIYGILKPGEKNRLVKPGSGHEEILCVVIGELVMHTPGGDTRLEAGHAIHIKEDESFNISNPSDETVVYVMAGGHSRPHH